MYYVPVQKSAMADGDKKRAFTALMNTLPLYLDVFNACARRVPLPCKPVRRQPATALLSAVKHRDLGTCCFCGFHSKKYQEAIPALGDYRDIDGIVTACIFCYQCFHLETIAAMRSGVLIFMPEIPQYQLHHLARQIYVCRISQGELADQARAVLEQLITRREGAKEKLATDNPAALATRMHSIASEAEMLALRATLRDIRLLPLDRRIIHEGDLEFNQFPQILAFWRSKDGPLNMAVKERFTLLPKAAVDGLAAVGKTSAIL